MARCDRLALRIILWRLVLRHVGDTPHKKLAAFLVAVSHGSVVCAKVGAPRATIRASHDVALQAVTAGHA